MPGVSKTQVELAKQIDLLSYLQTYEPENIIKVSPNEYCLKDHDSLKISNKLWHQFSTNTGGKTALDFLIKMRGIDFVNAVRILCNQRAPPVFSFQTVNNSPAPPKVTSEFILPTPNWNNSRVIAYLHNIRGIDSEIIDKCIDANILYESKKYSNCVFVGRDGTNTPRFACIRSTVSNFRQDIEGSNKKYCFNISSNNNDSRFLVVAESPIDILSIKTLHKMCGETYENYHYLALAGTVLISLIQYLSDHKQIDNIILALDNDSTGRKCADKIKEIIKTDETLKNRHISVISEPPKEPFKDYNDILLAVRQKQKEVIQKSRSNADIFI